MIIRVVCLVASVTRLLVDHDVRTFSSGQNARHMFHPKSVRAVVVFLWRCFSWLVCSRVVLLKFSIVIHDDAFLVYDSSIFLTAKLFRLQ